MAVGKSSRFTGLMTGLSGLEEETARVVENKKEEVAEPVVERSKQPIIEEYQHQDERRQPAENLDVSFKLHLNAKKRERLTARKTFIIPESYSRKLEEMAENAGMSQNQLFIKILEQMFGE